MKNEKILSTCPICDAKMKVLAGTNSGVKHVCSMCDFVWNATIQQRARERRIINGVCG